MISRTLTTLKTLRKLLRITHNSKILEKIKSYKRLGSSSNSNSNKLNKDQIKRKEQDNND